MLIVRGAKIWRGTIEDDSEIVVQATCTAFQAARDDLMETIIAPAAAEAAAMLLSRTLEDRTRISKYLERLKEVLLHLVLTNYDMFDRLFRMEKQHAVANVMEVAHMIYYQAERSCTFSTQSSCQPSGSLQAGVALEWKLRGACWERCS